MWHAVNKSTLLYSLQALELEPQSHAYIPGEALTLSQAKPIYCGYTRSAK